MSADLRSWTVARVRSAMTAAMRTDPYALDQLVEAGTGALDPSSASFVRAARTLTLGTSAALTAVLNVHRYKPDARDNLACAACGIGGCRTVRGISDVLAAYGLRDDPVDRPEAWRRADAWYTRTSGRTVLLDVEPFDDGFIARPAARAGVPDGVLIIDRDTGALTLWPAYDTDTLTAEYHTYKRATR
ncbi:hypothetical protein [Actinomadura decatromicini]|uniref:Uncharacterized protein n=1 Tax=Actinomadura decatromicini TaxID=2604572 RepID=A0A5D3F6I5_9ACTN|nr:hypothetical protein [Actinomadura decatromicini]TYK43416.1 hypothetical protein FXF68_38025 [Actinomadura decatromicini]